MIRKGKLGVPISGGQPNFSPTPNVLANSAQTSRDAQKLVKAAPAPFQNKQGPANAGTGRLNMKTLGIGYEIPSPVNAKPRSMGTRVMTGTTAQMLSAVGEPRLPKYTSPVQTGYPTRGNNRVVGGGNQPKVTAKQRAQYPGIFGSGRWRP